MKPFPLSDFSRKTSNGERTLRMMETVSKKWSRGLRFKDAGKEARVPQPLQPLPWTAACPDLQLPYTAVGALLKPGGDPYHIPASCLPSWPWDRVLLAPFPGWRGQVEESRKRGPLSKPPATTTPRVRARPRGQCTAPSLRPSLPLEECVL